MSQSVDERVVKMEFDNKQFEQNASTSMSTLEKLKEALKFDNVKDSFNQVTNAANQVDLSNIKNSAKSVKVSFSAMQIAGATAISTLTRSLMNFANNTVGGIFRQTVQGGINRAFNIEKAKFTIEGLGKSFKKLEGDINYAVSGTAYGFDEAAMAASSMAASGVKAGDEMKRALRGISGMAAMTGSSYSDMANIFTTVAGNGRLLSQQLNQFSARGMNAAATLRDYINKDADLLKKLIDAGLKSTNAKQVKEFADATKLTEKNVRALVSGSVIDFNLFAKAMDETFGEHAKAANKTFNGVMSNIKATLSRIGEAFIHPLIANNDMDNMLNILNTPLRKAINQTKKVLPELTKARKKEQKELFDILRQNKEYQKKTNKDLREEYKKNPKAFLEQVVKNKALSKDQAKALQKDMKTASDTFVDVMRSNTNAFFDGLKKSKQFQGKTNKEIIAEYKKNPKEFYKTLKDIEGYEKTSKSYLKDTIKYATASDKTIKGMYGRYKDVQYNIVGVLQAIKRFFGTIENGIKSSKLLKTFLSSAEKTCKSLIFLFNGLAATFGDVEKNGKKFVEIVGAKSHLISANKVWNEFRKSLGLTKDEFKQVGVAVDGLKSVFDLVKSALTDIAGAFKLSGSTSKTLRDTIFDLIEAFGMLLTNVTNFIKDSNAIEIFAFAIHFAFENIVKVISTVVDAFANLSKTIMDSKGFSRIQTVVQKLGKQFQRITDIIFSFAEAIIDGLLSPFKDGGKELEGFGGIVDTVLNGIASVLEWFSGILEVGITWFQSFIAGFKDFGGISGIIETVGKVIGGMALAVGNLFKTVGNFINKNIFSKFVGLFKNGSKDIKKGADSISNGFSLDFLEKFKNLSLGETVGKIFSGIINAVKNGFNAIATFDYGSIFQKIKTGFDNFVQFLGDLKDRIGEAFKNIGDAVSENKISFEGFGKALKEGIGKAIDTIVDLGPKVVGAVAALFKSVFSNIGKMLPEANSFGVAIADFFTKAIKIVVSAIPYIVEVLATAVRTLIANLPGIFSELADAIKEAFQKGLFEPIVIEVNGMKREIPPLFDVLSGAFKSIGEKFKNADMDQILGWLNKFLTAGVLNQLRKLLKANRKIPEEFGNFLDGLGKSVDKKLNPSLTDKIASLTNSLWTLAKAIGLIVGAVVVLALIPQDKLEQGATALGGIAYGIVVFCAAIAIINNLAGGGLADTVAGLGSLATGVASLIGVLMVLTLVNKGIEKSLAVLAVIFIELGAFIFALKKIAANPGEIEGIATSLGGFIEAIKTLVFALVVMAQIDAAKMYNAIVELGLVIAELGALVFAMSKIPVQTGLKATLQLLPMIIMLASVVYALYLLKKYELDPSSLGWIALCIGVMGGVIALLGYIPFYAGIVAAANLIGFVGALIVAALAMGNLYSALNKTGEIDKALDSFAQLMRKLGDIVGQFISGIGDAITDSLPGWAEKISTFFENLVPGLNAIKGLGPDIGSNVKGIAGAVKELATAGIGDAISSFLGGGSSNFAEFGTRFGEFVTALEGVAKQLQSKDSSLDSMSFAKIKKIANIIKDLAAIEKDIQAQGGLQSGIFGSKSFGKFSESLKKLFKGFKEIGKAAGEVENIDKIKQLSKISKALADCLAALPDEKTGKFWMDMSGSSKLSDFGKELVKFGKNMKEYVDSISGIETSGMKDVVKTVTNSLSSLSKTKIKGMSSVGKSATKDLTSGFSSKTISSALNKAVNSAAGSISLKGFKEAGSKLAKAFTDAISKSKDAAKKAGESLASSASSGMSSESAYNSGVNLGAGFVRGANAKSSAAYNAGYNLGSQALKGIRKALEEASPSKKARQSGNYFGAGFVIGIDNWLRRAGVAGSELGNSAMDSLKNTVKSSSSILGGMDTTPTIRPVLDLTNVQNGVNSINSMFGRNAYALSLAGSINGSPLNSRGQVNINNNITVDGAENPREWADEFAQELEIQARTRQ